MRSGTWLTRASLALGLLVVGSSADDAFGSQLQPCPQPCSGSSSNWTVFTSTDRLRVCEQPVLLDFAIHNPLDDPATHTKLRTCTAADAGDDGNGLAANGTDVSARDGGSCIASAAGKTMSLDVKTSGQGKASARDVRSALDRVRSYLQDSCDEDFIVGYSKGAVVAVYSGPGIDNKATISPILEHLSSQIGQAKTTLVQLCGQGRTSDHTFGIAMDTAADFAAVQKAIVAWSNATCFDMDGATTTGHLDKVAVVEAPLPRGVNVTSSASRLFARGDCRTTTVVSGDSCGALASRCGVSPNDFTKYNRDPKLCSALAVGQRVCYSAGTLPDVRPKPSKDGSCASYTVQSGDTCSSIANKNGLKLADLGTFNDKTTWGWFGCNDLMVGLAMCLSSGRPRMPAPVPNAVCGPIKPGSVPDPKVSLADMNPCPLNSCCDIWGQCGITPEYCVAEKGPTGNPGTAPAGHNGCVSHCGTKIVSGGSGPGSFIKIGYYESWNWDRPCLNMRADSIDTSYTHAHWGFGTVGPSFGVSINDTYKQWDDFTSLYGIKKIVSLGGWGYSTDPATHDVLRRAMNPENVGAFTDNVVKFLNDNKLDGVDFDWEYPGAPDIPGIPPGLKSDGPNYLSMLKTLRGKMPKGKTVSIAAPASFWYLRSFPVADMAKHLDYIVYMTYDLHGQWDYGNAWSQDGCPSGSCLRSHVNLTETNYALAMITKAGVPANMIVVGVSSYGRSFGMTKPGCTGPMCTFGGTASTAREGRCTDTAGYMSNAEIYEILGANQTSDEARTWYDTDSNSDIMTYDGNQWVAFMSQTTKSSRTGYYKGLNFAGTVDWAVDLQDFTDEDRDFGDDDDGLPQPAPIMPACTASYATLEDLDGAAGSIPDNCKAYYLAQTLSNMLGASVNNYTDMMAHGYADKFKTYANAVADSAGSSVHDYVYNNGDKYFSCTVTEMATCCDYCKPNELRPSYCDYCFDGGACYKWCNSVLGCPSRRGLESDLALHGRDVPFQDQIPITQIKNVSEPCPPDYSKRGEGPDNPYEQSVYWTLRGDKSDAFYADLLTNTGIPKDKIKMGDYVRFQTCVSNAGPDDACHALGTDFGIPMPNGYGASDVTDPHAVVAKALGNSNNLVDQLAKAVRGLKLNCYDGDGFELVDSISVPVLMVAEAVSSMAQVDAVVDKMDEEKRKALILAFLGAVLFFVPIAGEVLGSLTQLADVSSILAILGAVGNAALDVYTIVDDPNNAPLAIFNLVLEPLALTDLAKIRTAASYRRGMDDADVAKLGERVAARMGTIKKVTGTCHKA
ncbi:Killer toxin alpha/beta [Tolypocladium paradoxum]|uniref:chitinase n=1 Tax=Tolypocladium paradoxum TaxID=94208 RepID=A0A2S4KY95_9HYPO|nr:Killer toxin alpha/beta [Tolypocladium paradoxum]